MYKKILYTISIILLLIIYSCNNPKKVDKTGFVELVNNKFEIEGKVFFPMVLNYKVSLINKNNQMWPAPFTGYYNSIVENNLDKDSCLILLKSDFQTIKDMGFNSIRVVGIGEELCKIDDKDSDKYLNAIKDMYSIAKEVDLKVIFLLPMWPKQPELYEKYKALLIQEKENKNILAYDFFNEPLYFDTVPGQRRKKDVYRITKEWKEYMQEYSPKHLLTVGLASSKEVGVWDPNVLDVDFVSFHPYEYSDNLVLKEIYWYSKNVKKPWIIGETSLSADNDSIPYSQQKDFAEKVIQQTINGGGIGFSWWQYKDVEWGEDDFHSNYMGLVTRTGETQTSDTNLRIIGSLKDAVEVFKNFTYKQTDTVAVIPDNYYNSCSNKTCIIKGILYDEDTELPIINATIVAWNKDWSKPFVTYTKNDGSFELYADTELYQMRISASYYSTIWYKTNIESKYDITKKPIIIDVGKQYLEIAEID